MTTPATPVETVSRWLDLDLTICPPEVRDAIAALVKAERERAWQPIETAPKDGTRVLGRFPFGEWDEQVGEITYRPDWVENQGSPWLWSDADDTFAVSPTHWQPLPPLPSQVTK